MLLLQHNHKDFLLLLPNVMSATTLIVIQRLINLVFWTLHYDYLRTIKPSRAASTATLLEEGAQICLLKYEMTLAYKRKLVHTGRELWHDFANFPFSFEINHHLASEITE